MLATRHIRPKLCNIQPMLFLGWHGVLVWLLHRIKYVSYRRWQHNLVPESFVDFNHAYPIRYEGVAMLWTTVLLLQSLPPHSNVAQTLSHELAHRVSAGNVVSHERQRLWRLRDVALQVHWREMRGQWPLS